MTASLSPPVSPMLARLVRELPEDGEYVYEPKGDGFRCLAFRRGGDVELWSRHGRPLARYFPELTEALGGLAQEPFVVDGEIVVVREGAFDFDALLQRLHPAASRVDRLRAETPAWFIAFDVLAEDDDLVHEPFLARRERLERLLKDASPPLFLTPATRDPAAARRWLDSFHGDGVDGVVAKRHDLTYQPGKRAMLKVKHLLTADCVVAGFRWHLDEPVVGSLLLGLFDGEVLRHVGLASSFPAARRKELLAEIKDHVTALEGHPWERGFNVAGGVGRLPGVASRWAYGDEITWVPLRPELVCEVAYDNLHQGRFRHPPRFRRWRHDRDPRSCTFEQFEEPPIPPAELLAS